MMDHDMITREILNFSMGIIRIYTQTFIRCDSEVFFPLEQRIVLHEMFAVWLDDNATCTDKLNRLFDAGNKLIAGGEDVLQQLRLEIEQTYQQVEKFERAFNRYCTSHSEEDLNALFACKPVDYRLN